MERRLLEHARGRNLQLITFTVLGQCSYYNAEQMGHKHKVSLGLAEPRR